MNKSTPANSNMEWADKIWKIGSVALDVFFEIGYGVRTNTVAWASCFFVGSAFCLSIIGGWDYFIFKRLGISFIYPRHFPYFHIYCLLLASTGFLLWGMWQVALKIRLVRRLTDTFISSGLKSGLGKLPSFIFDRPIDAETRMLRLGRSHLPKASFDSAKPHLESALQIYIDAVREDRESGTVDIIYAHKPMAEMLKLENAVLPADHFIVGATRSGVIQENLEDVPHLLIAGQTGGGKSTYMRQLITTLYVSNSTYDFTLIDLKGGLEFQTFENLKRIKVVSTLGSAIAKLTYFERELDFRYELLKKNRCKDLAAYLKIPENKRLTCKEQNVALNLSRHVIIIDEVAEIFLAGSMTAGKDAQEARRAAGKISRLGRATGIHLIVGTQRPDKTALDTQIKANLIGKICFQMGDTVSSMVVLSNARARDLPAVAGRAIWQIGMQQVEVQVPYLSIEDTEKILQPFRVTGI